MHPDHDCPLGLRAPARLQPRHRLQGVVVGGPAPVRAAARDQRQLPVVDPVLDSVFVGDTLAPRSVYLRDGSGGHHDPGPVSWSINPSTVATVDAAGRVAGKAKGSAVVFATAAGVTSGAIVVVSRPLA